MISRGSTILDEGDIKMFAKMSSLQRYLAALCVLGITILIGLAVVFELSPVTVLPLLLVMGGRYSIIISLMLGQLGLKAMWLSLIIYSVLIVLVWFAWKAKTELQSRV